MQSDARHRTGFRGAHRRVWLIAVVLAAAFTSATAPALAEPPAGCHKAVIVGELTAGASFGVLLGNGLRVWFQPIASGWILRILPANGTRAPHDYAELATPPYNSVNPLSLSTDFAFRAQDAIGWNPRRFQFAVSEEQFGRLSQLYKQVLDVGPAPDRVTGAALSAEMAHAAAGKLTIIDSRLIPGMANQWRAAAAVATSFERTAHTFSNPPDGKPVALGKLLWVRFKLELDLLPGFLVDRSVQVVPYPCGSL